jgi:hypothetical protein
MLLPRLTFILGLLVLITLIGVLTWWTYGFFTHQEQPETPLVAFADRPSPVPLRILLEAPATYVCQQGKCLSAPDVSSFTPSVTDGQWWYYYRQDKNKVYLRRTNPITGQTDTIMESTPLTFPHGLTISPDGAHVAFWLDNIDQPAEQLTELWAYDVKNGGIRLLAEKLYRPDIRSDIYWNAQATHLWFIADTGEQSLPHDVLELLLLNVSSPGTKATFSDVPWVDILPHLSAATVDLSQNADHLAYITTNFLGNPVLTVQTPTGKQRATIRGQVKYVQWLEDNSLLYALQDGRGFTFWRVREGAHRFIARRPGQLTSARSDITGEHIAFTTHNDQRTELASLHISSGQVTQEGIVPNVSAPAKVIYVEQQSIATPEAAAKTASGLEDAQIAAAIATNFAAITGEEGSQPLRLIMTAEANTVFLDYRNRDEQEHRLQVRIHDAINNEWSIKARYEPVNREWKKVQGGGLVDPQPTRLYEWELSLKRWILKERL